jgi:signal transduction histidine kinase
MRNEGCNAHVPAPLRCGVSSSSDDRPHLCARYPSYDDCGRNGRLSISSVATAVVTSERRNVRTALLAVSCAASVAVSLTAWFVARSPVLTYPVSDAIARAAYVAAYVAAGAYIWYRRPESRLGPLVAGSAFVLALTTLNASGDPLTHTIGMVIWAGWVVLTVFVYLSFPNGRLESELERGFIAALVATTAVVWTLIVIFAHELPPGSDFNGCDSRCPHNDLQLVSTSDHFSSALTTTYNITTAIALLGIAMLIFVKARSPARWRRRAMEPLSYCLIASIGIFVVELFLLSSYPGTTQFFRVVDALVLFAIPGAMIIGQTRGRIFAASRAVQLVAAMDGSKATPAQVQDLAREALGDPTLRLVLASPGLGGYVDVDGNPVELPPGSDERAVTRVESGGRTGVAFIHDPLLDVEDSVVEGLAATSQMLLQNAQLVRDLRASRERILTAAERERRRLERDLHDGAQQRLMAIQVKLALAREQVSDEDLGARLDEVAVDAEIAVDELRALAHGIYPSVLVERGLPEALRSFAAEAPVPVRVLTEHVGRFSPSIEAAFYFCALEAIQNAAKHGGADASVEVRLERHGDTLELEIEDKGRGFNPAGATEGIGLINMRDRIGAVGGTLQIVSSSRGTLVTASVPV